MKDIKILLIEDNPADAELVIEVFKQLKMTNPIEVMYDSSKALEYLKTNKPDMIFLDLNLPKISGLELLAIIKADANLKYIPVIGLTTSNTASDIRDFYDLGGNSFLTKPLGLQEFLNCVSSVGDFWFKLVKLPTVEK